MTGRVCPNCGRNIATTSYACPACWRRLPAHLKHPILSAYHRGDWAAHKAAKAAAQDWYAANPATRSTH